ncbi:putative cytochrome P450 [Helianthus annuus]|uniref:Cytochrome P450 n=1 Tax=Helianthus annuus TaxID=4232 RepID=A0A251SDT9_HELAN|nr:germacrene A acid 8-beta-hydroxylase-like [Helianthus annuus]KAF5767405.1 putative cytochrome P450 [Helianthus annuus]KAJ0462953.1 putative cytochrome P450 [Helianthus annuus]KAJ0484311.1 putative cytochrome P450 [Helianthus annuus]KAJ0658599.1 putative cytochrome P450 [Helianthus annuus]KAJ0838775.1 putative cytochrome P450 [Helianthus annuus]
MDAFTIIYVLTSFLILFTCWSLITSKNSKKLPPGPPKLPIIGNIHQLEKQTPHRRLRDLARKYGPIMHLQLGQVSTVVISTPQLAHEILKIQDLSFLDRPTATTSQIFYYNATNIAFSSYGNYWRQIKKIATLELLSVKKVRSFFHIREEELNHAFKFLDSSSETTINFRDLTIKTVSNIVSRAALGDVSKEREYLVDCAYAQLRTFNAFHLFNYYPSLSFFNVISGKKAKWMKMHMEVDVILEDILKEHRSRPRSIHDHEDLLDVLLRVKDSGDLDFPITDDNIKSIVLEMLTAGTSSSSMTIEWAFSEMMRNPKIMKKAQSEVRSIVKGNTITEANIQSMHYMKLVVKETMRLHGVPILLPRLNPVDCVVNGYDIPAKTRVLINSWACATDPGSWENPDSFIPERFENSSISYAGFDFEFLPFGAGRRMCPGMNFGLGTVEYVIANLLYHYDWKLPNGVKPQDVDMREITGISTLPINPLQIVPISISERN